MLTLSESSFCYILDWQIPKLFVKYVLSQHELSTKTHWKTYPIDIHKKTTRPTAHSIISCPKQHLHLVDFEWDGIIGLWQREVISIPCIQSRCNYVFTSAYSTVLTITVECRYYALQNSMMLHTSLQELRRTFRWRFGMNKKNFAHIL